MTQTQTGLKVRFPKEEFSRKPCGGFGKTCLVTKTESENYCFIYNQGNEMVQRDLPDHWKELGYMQRSPVKHKHSHL